MEENKLVKLILRLENKSKRDQLDWESTDIEDVYQLTFPNYTVRLSSQLSKDYPGDSDYFLSIYNQVGSLVERASDIELSDYLSDAYKILKGIHEKARRKAMGVDTALDEILDSLGEDDEDDELTIPSENKEMGKEEDNSDDESLPF